MNADNRNHEALDVEIWLDIACPFCFIGKRNFEQALGEAGAADRVNVIYRSFLLDPDAPRRDPLDLYDRLAEKFGRSRDEVIEMNRHVAAMGKSAGVELNFDKVVQVNTFDAHRVLKLGVAAGLGSEVADSLLGAYFSEGLDLGDHEVLVRVGERAGLEADQVAAEFAEDSVTTKVWEDMVAAQELGISAVPAYVFGRRAMVSGAQKPSGFVEVLGQVLPAASNGLPPLEVVRRGPA